MRLKERKRKTDKMVMTKTTSPYMEEPKRRFLLKNEINLNFLVVGLFVITISNPILSSERTNITKNYILENYKKILLPATLIRQPGIK